MIDFSASQSWYVDHLAPVWKRLPHSERGLFWTDDPGTEQHLWRWGIVPTTGHFSGSQASVLVGAAWRDVKGASPKLVLMEHGAGQTYTAGGRNHPAYAAGHHPGVVRHLVPRPAMVVDERTVWIGNPRLDRLHRFIERSCPPKPIVGFTWHWRCNVEKEAGTAFTEYQEAIRQVAQHYEVFGSAHPRILDEAAEFYKEAGIPWTPYWDELEAKADILVADNSSVMYEFAALGKPVVLVNKSTWRRNMNHGLRFWDTHFPMVNEPASLLAGLRVVEAGYENFGVQARVEAEHIYGPIDSQSTERAVAAIMEINR